MEQPPVYVVKRENMLCKLKKAIYDLKQNLLVWFDKFSCIISEVGFQKCYSDHSIFIRMTSSDTVILFIYVDILLTGSDVHDIEKAKQYLKV